jgi:parallel beta-helix repeat protein
MPPGDPVATKPSLLRQVTRNLKPSIIIIILPLIAGVYTVYYVLSGSYSHDLRLAGNQRLVTSNWQAAVRAFIIHQPTYHRNFAYYKVLEGQTLQSLSEAFSVNPSELAKLNPGTVAPGTTIMVPPVEHALAEAPSPNSVLTAANVKVTDGVIHLSQPFSSPQAITDIPQLANLLSSYSAIIQTGPDSYRITKPFILDDNIRLDITSRTVKRLELESGHNFVTCLCLNRAQALFKDTLITSYDPAAKGPDTNWSDGRSFVRNYNGRLDIIGSTLSNLGNSADLQFQSGQTGSPFTALEEDGATYGASWRISAGSLGANIATGWVEKSRFEHNYFGAYTFGASGITWKNSRFDHNTIYGLDPHDDSNNALVTLNTFDHNGKHGFIMSKRCDYNEITNNTSFGNKLHGFMLHENSSYNVLSGNLAYGNFDNYVIYNSNFNTLDHNQGYNPFRSQIRISNGSLNNFIQRNTFSGGRHGIFIYNGSANALVQNNTIKNVSDALYTQKANNVVFASNQIEGLKYKIAPHDRLIFGPNVLDSHPLALPTVITGVHPHKTLWQQLSSVF